MCWCCRQYDQTIQNEPGSMLTLWCAGLGGCGLGTLPEHVSSLKEFQALNFPLPRENKLRTLTLLVAFFLIVAGPQG
jgi:hypothetical protein